MHPPDQRGEVREASLVEVVLGVEVFLDSLGNLAGATGSAQSRAATPDAINVTGVRSV